MLSEQQKHEDSWFVGEDVPLVRRVEPKDGTLRKPMELTDEERIRRRIDIMFLVFLVASLALGGVILLGMTLRWIS